MADAKEEVQEAMRMMDELILELQAAIDADAAASIEEAEALHRASDCRNRLNKAQKEMDAWYATQRQAAAQGSDWARTGEDRQR